jgi:hypothetical protein
MLPAARLVRLSLRMQTILMHGVADSILGALPCPFSSTAARPPDIEFKAFPLMMFLSRLFR